MLIHWLEFENYTTGQKIKRIDFDHLNLLVGVSGAGKTQILKTISKYVDAIAKGESIPFAGKFSMCFSVDAIQEHGYPEFRDHLVWSIETKALANHTYVEGKETGYEVVKETLVNSDATKSLFIKDENGIRIEDWEMPKMSSEKSVLCLFVNPPYLSNIRANCSQVRSYFHQMDGLKDIPIKYAKDKIAEWKKNEIGKRPLSEIKRQLSQYPTLLAIYLAKYFTHDLYDEFLTALQTSFPVIEDVLISDRNGDGMSELAIFQDGTWITIDDISGGMQKAIYIIANICFTPDESVILFDELENALGVNCLDDIVGYICAKSAENHQQFIITSHHPYIINNIPVKDWRIISQNHGIIETKSVEEANIDTEFNRQEAFFQLINYLQG